MWSVIHASRGSSFLLPREHLVEDFHREFDPAAGCLVINPIPELRYLIDGVVRVARGDEDVSVEEMQHGSLARTSHGK